MELVFTLIVVFGVLYLFVSIINSANLRDPKKLDVIKISKLDEETLDNYPFVTMLTKSYSRATYGRSTNKVNEKLKVYSVVLLNSTHRRRIKLSGFDTMQEAKQELLEISKKYNKKIVRYNPQVSQQTSNRR
ncbi:MAG: hypothetical protein ABF242_07265 [Flavobacteriales bacterium]